MELRKLELGRALAAQPKVLIADEVMAGLSDSEVDEILAFLKRLNAEGISILLIEHIMRAVMMFSQRIVVIVAGRKIADGLPDDVMNRMKSKGLILANSIAIEGLHAGYGEVRVLSGISMNVQSGETVVLLGTNGNGKSTLMKCIMGQVRPTAGRILATIEGNDIRFDSGEAPKTLSGWVFRLCRKAGGFFRSLRWKKIFCLARFARSLVRASRTAWIFASIRFRDLRKGVGSWPAA